MSIDDKILDEINSAVTKEINKKLLESLEKQREFLESQLKHVKWSVVIIVTVGISFFVWSFGKTTKDVEEEVRAIVTDKIITQKVQGEFDKRLQSQMDISLNSISTKQKIQNNIDHRVDEYTSRIADSKLEKALAKKLTEIKELSSSDLTFLMLHMVPVGTIVPYISDTPPNGWLICDGSKLEQEKYPELYQLLKSFRSSQLPSDAAIHLPDLRGRVPVGEDRERTSDLNLGLTLGSEEHSLSEDELPPHHHDLRPTIYKYKYFFSQTGSENDVGGKLVDAGPSAPDYDIQTEVIQSNDVGKGEGFSLFQPSLVVSYIIKY
jgi:microcystin-dependent protein